MPQKSNPAAKSQFFRDDFPHKLKNKHPCDSDDDGDDGDDGDDSDDGDDGDDGEGTGFH